MLCVKKPHWMVSLITVTMTLLSAGLCMAQNQANTTDYVAELNKLGIAGRPESDNAAPYYQKAIELLVSKPTDLTISTRSWPKELPAQEQAVLRKWVQDNNAALEQIQLGSQKSYCWFTQAYQKPQTEMPRLTPIRELAMALQARAMLQAEDGNVSGAVNDIVTLYRFGVHIAEGPKLLVEKLTGLGVKSFAITAAFNILDKKMIDIGSMKNLQNQLEQLSPKQNEPFDIRGEKIYMQGQVETDPKSIAFKPYLKNVLGYYDTMAVKTPWQIHNEPAQAPPSGNFLVNDMAKIIEIEYRSRTDTQALITTLAVLRYKSDKGMYPASLPELVPAGYIKELPTDPFSNKPLVYKQTRESFTLYSFGVDYDDDGGDMARDSKGNVKMWADEGDAVFWPVQSTEVVQKQVAERKLPTGPEQEKLTESLHNAIINGDIEQIKSFISKGADVNAKNRQTWTSLHTALWYGNSETVKLLISEGADVNAQDNSGNTPLHFAAIKGDSDAVNLLIEKGANINAKTNAEQTPLMFAADYGHKEIVELLISKGADVNAQARNDNALSLARRKNSNEIVDLLLKHGAKEPTPILDEGLYGRRGQTEGPERQLPGGLQGFEGQAQPGSSLVVISRTGDKILADANEIKAKVKTYEGLAESLEEIESKSRLEKSAWAQKRIDNRTSLIRLVEEQVKLEMTFVRKIAAEEKAEKTTKTIDDVLLSRDDISGRIYKELLAQRREARQSQQQEVSRGRGMARGGRGRGRNLQEGYQQGYGSAAGPGQEMARREGGYGRRDEPGEGEQLASETQNKINQWLQTTLDNKETLMQFVYTDVRTQYAFIQTVAVEEEAKKTAAAIDGILLSREERLQDIVLRMQELAEREQQMQDGRDHNLRTTRGRSQPGQEQYMDESASRSRRR
jgi:hypothetical protein